MEKNNQPIIIIAAIVGGIILIIALALIFTRNGEATTPEITNPGNTGEIENEEEQEETSQQPSDPQQPQQPADPQTPQQPSDPQTPQEPEQPTSDTLPDNWDQLTSQQKTNLNPFECDIETQYIRADNGQCQDIPLNTPSNQQKYPLALHYSNSDEKTDNHYILNCFKGGGISCFVPLGAVLLEDMQVAVEDEASLITTDGKKAVIFKAGFFKLVTEDGRVYSSNISTAGYQVEPKREAPSISRATTEEKFISVAKGESLRILVQFKIPQDEELLSGSILTLTSDNTTIPSSLDFKAVVTTPPAVKPL